MKQHLLSLIAALTLSTSGFAAGQKLISINQLKADAKGIQSMIGDNHNCALTIHKIENGIRISMSSEREGVASIDALHSDAVLLDAQFDTDGSFKKEYIVPGRGTLTAISADDSYFHATLETQGQKISCELDF